MKKFIAMLLVAMMALSLVACGEKPAPTPDPTPSASTYKTGLGMVTSMSGTDAEDEDPAKTQADVTVCEATFDQDGKIVAISFDVVQAKATVDADGVVTVAEDVKTKLELEMPGGVLIGNPIQDEYAMDFDYMEGIITKALELADAQHIHGKEITPFLLAHIKELTGGESFASNVQLALNNARCAARIAVSLAKM